MWRRNAGESGRIQKRIKIQACDDHSYDMDVYGPQGTSKIADRVDEMNLNVVEKGWASGERRKRSKVRSGTLYRKSIRLED